MKTHDQIDQVPGKSGFLAHVSAEPDGPIVHTAAWHIETPSVLQGRGGVGPRTQRRVGLQMEASR